MLGSASNREEAMSEQIIRYPIEQYAYYVSDIEAACQQWAEVFGAGPFFMDKPFVAPSDDFVETYRGSPTEAHLSYAWGQCGPDHHIQLIEQHNDAPSIYRDMFAKGDAGLHHIAICLNDVPEEKERFAELGFPSVTEISVGGQLMVAYVDARSMLGCFVELYTENPNSRRNFNEWKEAHESWDGKTRLIRPTNW